MDDKIREIADLIEIQGADGNCNHDSYMRGLYNGLVLAMSVLTGDEPPVYKNAPDKQPNATDSSSAPKDLTDYAKQVEELRRIAKDFGQDPERWIERHKRLSASYDGWVAIELLTEPASHTGQPEPVPQPTCVNCQGERSKPLNGCLTKFHYGQDAVFGWGRVVEHSTESSKTSTKLSCVQCGGAVEASRECYALPTCYECLPPTKPLSIAKSCNQYHFDCVCDQCTSADDLAVQRRDAIASTKQCRDCQKPLYQDGDVLVCPKCGLEDTKLLPCKECGELPESMSELMPNGNGTTVAYFCCPLVPGGCDLWTSSGLAEPQAREEWNRRYGRADDEPLLPCGDCRKIPKERDNGYACYWHACDCNRTIVPEGQLWSKVKAVRHWNSGAHRKHKVTTTLR